MATLTLALRVVPTEWPDATNTGVPDGTSLTPSSGFTVTTSRATVQDLDITGTLSIEADNVLVRRCRLTNTQPVHLPRDGLEPHRGGLRTRRRRRHGTAVGFHANNIFRRLNIYGCENGVNCSEPNAGTLRDCYIHDLTTSSGAHAHGVQVSQDSDGVLIEHKPDCGGDRHHGGHQHLGRRKPAVHERDHLQQFAAWRGFRQLPLRATDGQHVRRRDLHQPQRFISVVCGAVNGAQVGVTVTEFNGNVHDDTGLPLVL
jgi:hypothetical protein